MEIYSSHIQNIKIWYGVNILAVQMPFSIEK